MSQTPNPILVKSTRSGLTEKFHRGAVCMVDEQNRVIVGIGDIETPVFPRSALKYFQVLPLLMSGADEDYGFTEKEIALMCASHSGEPEHLAVAESILSKAGLDPSFLQCGPHAPVNAEANASLIRAGQNPTDLHNNCSGKHSGFLALSKFLGAPLQNYLRPEHPVQAQVRKVVSQLCLLPEDQLYPGIDGCSAPNYAMPLRQLAIGFKNLGFESQKDTQLGNAIRKMISSIQHHPEMVGGTGRYCTEMMQVCGEKVIGKLGADGVYALSIQTPGLGAAIKIDDGTTGPQYVIAQELINRLGLFPPAQTEPLQKWKETEIRNCNGFRTGFTTIANGIGEQISEILKEKKAIS